MGRPLKWQANPAMQQIISKNRADKDDLHWLELQRAERYVWRRNMRRMPQSVRTYFRRMGVVESLFDEDGSSYCGRADLHQNLRFELKTDLTEKQLRERIVLAWTVMRHSHVLLATTTAHLHDIGEGPFSTKWVDKCFVYAWPKTVSEAIAATEEQVFFVGSEYPEIDARDFFQHVLNTSRALDQKKSLSRLHVMPLRRTDRGTVLLHMIPILAHQITDGLTTYRWTRHFTAILNSSTDELMAEIEHLLADDNEMLQRLPPAQEALYPVRSFSPARERWHWLITRILRHVHKPPPAAFQNPLRRDQIPSRSSRFPSKYDKVLDYSTVPPLNAGHISVDVDGRAMRNLRMLCKQSGISVGSGCFVLVAMVMMALEERRNPDLPVEQRVPFVGSFPVNPRPFFSGTPTTGNENSCMLAFSDGVTLPFLSNDLDLVGRFKLLGRQAHRQLRQYQKKRDPKEEIRFGSTSPGQLIPALYCSTLERMEGRVKQDAKAGINVSGKYPAASSSTMATCGISSVGDVSGVAPPKIDLQAVTGKELAADLRGFSSTVRPRDGEFLVGAVGNTDYLGFGVAYDATAIDPAKAEEWAALMKSMLDKDLDVSSRAKL